MTRKKTTTGTMGSKRKTESKAKATVEKVSASKASEHKANEVIPEVAIALLESHPELPERDAILGQFADYFRAAQERAAAAAAAIPAPEPEKPRSAERKVRPTLDARPRFTSTFDAPVVEAAPVLDQEPAHDVVEAASDAEPDVAVAHEPEHDPFSPFATSESASEPEDLFALLAGETTAKPLDEDFDFTYQTASDQSSPFLAAPADLVPADDGATMMISAFEDDSVFGTPNAQEALPAEVAQPIVAHIEASDATMMIQAMPDDEPAAEAEPAVDAEAETTARKSRKSSKKRRG